MKDMIYKRIEHSKKEWWEVLYPVLLTYNQKMVHSVTKHTPEEALTPSNTSMVNSTSNSKKETVDDTLSLKLAMLSEYSKKIS